MTSRLRKVLLVDDDELNLEILEEVLGGRFDLRTASSGEAALVALTEFPAELVLLDIVMPGIDGYETCRRITSEPSTVGTKVILVSARGRTEERVRGYAVGACDYVVKPFDVDELAAKVDVFLALKSAQDESRAKSEFVTNMSHEIRTPMTAILGYSENLRDSSLSEEARQHAIDTIWRNGQYLLELINNILDLSKIEANRLQVEQMECNPGEVIADVVSMMSARVESAGLSLTVEYDGEIPARMISDRTRLKQVLINLVGNAIKFTERGSVRIVVRLLRQSQPGPLLQVDVIDTGIGIAAEHVASLCEPFVQADATVTRRFGGTGMGLSISRRLARLLGGDVTIRSEPGRGSTFTMTVATGDLAGVAMCADFDGAVPRRALPTTGKFSVPRIPCRILLAEDGLDNQRLLSFVLHKAGAEVIVADNGQAAVDTAVAAAADRPFDVILMDMQMPVLDGYAATALLRKSGYRGPIVAITAHALAGDRERCLAAGCDRFAPKPIDRDDLIRTIHDLLERP